MERFSSEVNQEPPLSRWTHDQPGSSGVVRFVVIYNPADYQTDLKTYLTDPFGGPVVLQDGMTLLWCIKRDFSSNHVVLWNKESTPPEWNGEWMYQLWTPSNEMSL